MVIENELNHEECNFCRKSSGGSLGMQLSCSYEGCDTSMHPICAYLNGCLINVKKDHKKLIVEAYCK